MNDDIHLDGVLRKNASSGLYVITSGIIPPNPAEILGSEKMSQIISGVTSQVDLIVLDSPPLTVVTDATVLSKHVDGVLLVISSRSTKLDDAQKAIEQLRRINANIIGVVLNNVGLKDSRYYYTSDYSEYKDQLSSDRIRTSTVSTEFRKAVLQSSQSKDRGRENK